MCEEKLILFDGIGCNDIIPVCLGEEYCAPGKASVNQMRNFYLFHYVVEGKGKYIVDGITYNVSAGEVFFLKEYQLCDYFADEKDPWHYIWVGFTGKYAIKLNQLNSPVFKMDGKIFYEMIEADFNKYSREEFIVGKIYILMSMLIYSEKTDDYVLQVINYIHMSKMDVNEIARAMNVERHYLSRLFKKKMGMTIQEYALNKKIEMAKRYLEMNISIYEIADLLGYSDQFVFSKMFKKKVGMSPLQYKKQLCNKENT